MRTALREAKRKAARALWRRALRWDPSLVAPSLAPRTCNVCGYEGPFGPFGPVIVRPDARCPRCLGLERHRLFKLAFDRLGLLETLPRVLHFAPEKAMRMIVEPTASAYVTADLSRADVHLKTSIEAIGAWDGAFDLVIASHVLEHVDDRKALAEIYRVLAPGGTAALAVPIAEGWTETYEDPSIVDPAARRIHFEQEDHLRIYGRDFRDRVRAAGFALVETTATGVEAARHAIRPGERVFFARKPA
jgi:SAM-dependent methyltransferase